MIGGLREVGIEASDGRVLSRYEDMVDLARQVRESPRGVAFMASGWMYDGHDTNDPEYRPIPAIGGEAALVAAVDGVHAQGVAVTAYVNGRTRQCRDRHLQRRAARDGRCWARRPDSASTAWRRVGPAVKAVRVPVPPEVSRTPFPPVEEGNRRTRYSRRLTRGPVGAPRV